MAAVSQPMTVDPLQHRQELTERLNSLRRLESFCDVTKPIYKYYKLKLMGQP